MFRVRLSNGKKFELGEGETLLSAALRAGVALPYSCQTGRCGTCVGHVNSGLTTALHPESGLSEAEHGSRAILTCVRTAQSDVDIEVRDLGDISLVPAKTLPCRIKAIEAISADVLKISLRFPPGSALEYLPGQYIDVIGHNGVRRSYSIANAPSADATVELHIRKVQEGAMSTFWFDLAKVNDLLRVHGPLGTFFLRDVADVDLVFLATGTGIAPVKSILEGLASPGPRLRPRSILVLFGGRAPGDIYWDPRSIAVPLRFMPVLSRADESWGGGRGYVQQALLSTQVEWGRAQVYACGSDSMIRDARSELIAAGLNSRNFFSDAFVSSGPAPGG